MQLKDGWIFIQVETCFSNVQQTCWKHFPGLFFSCTQVQVLPICTWVKYSYYKFWPQTGFNNPSFSHHLLSLGFCELNFCFRALTAELWTHPLPVTPPLWWHHNSIHQQPRLRIRLSREALAPQSDKKKKKKMADSTSSSHHDSCSNNSSSSSLRDLTHSGRTHLLNSAPKPCGDGTP